MDTNGIQVIEIQPTKTGMQRPTNPNNCGTTSKPSNFLEFINRHKYSQHPSGISNRFYNETILIQIQDNPNSQRYGKSESNPGRIQFFIAKTSDSTSSVSPKGVYLKKCPSSQEI